MTDISHTKMIARKQAFTARKPAFNAGLDEAANRNLIGHISVFPEAEIISGYMPIRTEISPIATMTILHRQGKRICVPMIQGAAQPLLFREWTPTSVMVNGPFGAQVPSAGDFLAPDILITPLLSFDPDCYRLGYGGGFYDRSFEQLMRQKTTIGIGFAYNAQQIPTVPRNATDHQLDAVVTEVGVLTKSN